jgi:hypothetical protein
MKAKIKIGFDYENASELEQKLRELEFLFGTEAGTCVGDRDFGIDNSFIGYPMDVAENLFVVEAEEKVEKYVPDMKIDNIEFSYTDDGQMIPEIFFIRNENYQEGDGDV